MIRKATNILFGRLFPTGKAIRHPKPLPNSYWAPETTSEELSGTRSHSKELSGARSHFGSFMLPAPGPEELSDSRRHFRGAVGLHVALCSPV